MTSKEIGDWGENKACEYLEQNKIRVIKRNFHCRGGEIDIIAKDSDTIVFIEVKTRCTKAFGTPCEFVDFRKQEKIISTALLYTGRDDISMRFDVIEILYTRGNNDIYLTEVNHIKNAF